MEDFKCGDFFIIRLRNYADAKILKKYHDSGSVGPLPKQHYERAQAHNLFFWKLIEKVTGKDRVYWYGQYMFEAIDCVKDEIHETHGIHISDGEGWVTYFIPIRHKRIISWFQTATTVPSKIIKRANLFYINYYKKEVDKTRRADSKRRTLDFQKEHNL